MPTARASLPATQPHCPYTAHTHAGDISPPPPSATPPRRRRGRRRGPSHVSPVIYTNHADDPALAHNTLRFFPSTDSVCPRHRLPRRAPPATPPHPHTTPTTRRLIPTHTSPTPTHASKTHITHTLTSRAHAHHTPYHTRHIHTHRQTYITCPAQIGADLQIFGGGALPAPYHRPSHTLTHYALAPILHTHHTHTVACATHTR